jgi:hypothetical protein
MCAVSVAKLIVALTPATLFSAFSTEFTQEEQVMPWTDKVVGSSGVLLAVPLLACVLLAGVLLACVLIVARFFSVYYGFKPLITALCSTPLVETPLPPKGPL